MRGEVTEDERVIVYDGKRSQYWIVEDPEVDLRGWLEGGGLGPAVYSDAMLALGLRPVIDI